MRFVKITLLLLAVFGWVGLRADAPELSQLARQAGYLQPGAAEVYNDGLAATAGRQLRSGLLLG